MVPLLLAVGLVFSQQVPAAPQRGQNLLANPSFEQGAAGWTAAGKGFAAAQEGQDGAAAIVCESAEGGETLGAMQEVAFDPPIRHPFRVSGWSKAERAEGADYCLYLDCWYADGTNLWGQRGDFTPGTHPWERVEYTFDVAKPVAKIQFFILFRRCTGKAWFDNLSLSLAPFAVERERALPGLYGGNSIDYSARLSLPASWTASVVSGERELHATRGQGPGVALAWNGTDAAGTALPGGDYTVRVVAKDDLLGEALRHDVPVRTLSRTPKPYAAWVETSMVRVFPDSVPETPTDQPRAEIAMAGNEYESFQLAIRPAPGRELTGGTVELIDLRDQRGRVLPNDRMEWQLVGFVKLEQLYKHPMLPDAVPGWWPDPLLPASTFSIPGGQTQALWFTVHAPAGTSGGDYQGDILIRFREAPLLRLPVKVSLYDFDLPVQAHLKTAFALMDGYLEKLYGPLTPKLRRAYGDFVLRHRLNPDDISRTEPPDPDDLAYYYNQGLNAYNVLNMVEPRGKRPWVCWSPLEVYTPSFRESLIRTLDPYVGALKTRGLVGKAYVYTFDERGPEFYPTMREYFGLIRQRYGLPTLTTAQVPQDPEKMKELNVTWNCPILSAYDYEKAEGCRQAGLQVWSYTCLGPRYPYANWLADDPLIEARVLFWQVYRERIDGFLYWGLNIWDRANNDTLIDPEKDGPRLKWSITTGGDYPWLNGDGELLYAGKDGPIGSIRLANIRDGIEDYEYLYLLARLLRNQQKAQEACKPVTESLTSFTRDPRRLYATREDIAGRVAKMIRH